MLRGATPSLEPIAYLTCEIKGRDLDSRALIAAHLVKRGYTAVVGQYWSSIFNAPAVPRGCYLFKTANQIQTRGMNICKMHGHDVVASDEEVLSAAEAHAHETTSAETFELCDLYLAVSEAHQRAIHHSFPASVGRVRVVGTSRFDLLRAADYPRPHEAPYVLFNTSFGLLNSIWGDVPRAVDVYRKGMQWNLKNPDHAAVMQARLEYEKTALHETRALVTWLAERGDIDIVIRPHPTENAAWWKKHHRLFPRVHVVQRSDPFPWMRHATLMIHNDSTTGVEAAVMGVPTLNLSPAGPWARRLILRDINYSVEDAAGSHDAIERLLAHGDGPIADARKNDPFPPNCAAAIADAMATIMPPPRLVGAFPWSDTARTVVQSKKFTVSPEEFSQSLARAFQMVDCDAYLMESIGDSVVRVSPQRI